MPAVANRSSDHLVLRAYALAFALALGVTVSNSFARFAYALVLPAMRSELQWSYAQAGWLNTANAIGYLIGAIFTRLVIRHTGNRMLFIGGVFLTALAILATGYTRDIFWLGVWRIVSGITGATAFIAGGALSGNLLPARPQTASTTIAIYFAGGGVGFLLCGVALPLLLDAAGAAAWPRAWVWMGWAALAMCCVCTWAARQIAEPGAAPDAVRDHPPGLPDRAGNRPTENSKNDASIAAARTGVKALKAGLAAYTLFGLGYIGYMTFVIAWMRDNGAGTGAVIAVWSAFGIASLAGPWLWRHPLTYWPPGRMLAGALAMVALGALLPLLHAGIASMLLSAALFGASMWNIPGAVTALAKRALPDAEWGAAVASFTIVFAIGQIAGPVLTGWLADAFGGLRVGLSCSVAVLALGALIALRQRDVKQPEPV